MKSLRSQRILIFDGAMGSEIIKAGFTAACNEYLNISQPRAISNIHQQYLQAGADVIETNTFGAARHVLAEYQLDKKTKQINKAAASIAKQATKKYHHCYVAGSIGPGSKLPSLGQISFTDLVDSYTPQVLGLLDGGVDCFIIETAQDLLQIKAALTAIGKTNAKLPIIVQVTLDENGRTLTGSDITAVLATLAYWPVEAIGLNCGLGPNHMYEAVKYLNKYSPKLVSVLPNAGLPFLENGQTSYKLSAPDFAAQMKMLAKKCGVNIVGGCCGTTPEHIKLLAQACKSVPARKPVQNFSATTASLFQAQAIDITPKPLIIGERANTNGSNKFRNILLDNNYQAAADLAVTQEAEGAHLIDVSVATVERDEKQDMCKVISILNTQTKLPLMIDSTDAAVVEAALQNISGRAVVNSINLEDGGIKAKKIIALCKRYQAAVVALAIDEQGMAITKTKKLAVIKRLISLIKKGGLSEADIFIDALTFTLGSGEEKTRNAGQETLATIKAIKKLWPKVNTILGVSNISYGLLLATRKFLNSVFLQCAIKNGLDAAILHSGKIVSLHSIPKTIQKLCSALIFNKNQSALENYIAYFSKHQIKSFKIKNNISDPEKLRLCIIEGIAESLEQTLTRLLKKHKPIDIINNILLPAMDKVGELFHNGQKQLPFVLRSAEVMRSAMNYLQPLLSKQAANKGVIVLATVRGDIHDIGKNLVDIIFSANGYKIINLGVKQSAANIAQAVKQYQPMAIGLSGLLVESVKAMKEYLEYFNDVGIHTPVICGGAALRAGFVEKDMKPIYNNNVYYAKDALDGLKKLYAIKKHSN